MSFAEVAAEDSAESLAHEIESTEAIDAADPTHTTYGVESDNDTAPEEPTLSSMLAPGPVAEGDDPAI